MALTLACFLPGTRTRAAEPASLPSASVAVPFEKATIPKPPSNNEIKGLVTSGAFTLVPEIKASAQGKSTSWWQQALSTFAFSLGALGYVSYFTRSVPKENRQNHLISRLGERLFPDEAFFKGNGPAMRVNAVNHIAMLMAGGAAALEVGAGVAPLAVPAAFLVGSLASYVAAQRYGNGGSLNPWVRSCEALAYGSLGVFVAAKLGLDYGALAALGTTGTQAAIWAGLTARALSMVPMAIDFVHAAKNPGCPAGFPPVRNQVLWWSASAGGAIAASFPLPLTQASIIPLGYFALGSVFFGTLLVCKKIWSSQQQAS